MSNIKVVIQLLIAGIKEDIANFEQYHQLLQQQQLLMKQHDSEQLLAINIRHERYHQGLLKQAEKRKKQLLSIGLTGDDKGMENIINALSEKPATQVRQMWQELKALVEQCKKQNEINGELLASQQLLISKLINPSQADAYSPN